ncbi:MAG TPA: DUF4381 domain-containing protein [Thermomonas sp.]|nr:DUF4381 domain-containing protein [Thermomonas sp.]
MKAPLPLRDVHEGIAPAWWPPAPGWWMVFAAIVLIAGFFAWRMRRARRRREAILRLFDETVDRAGTPSQQVAAMSELLRRAARRKHPDAGALDGEDWLRVLDDGLPQPMFAAGAGALLREGGFRPDVAAREAEALRGLARRRYLDWMLGA